MKRGLSGRPILVVVAAVATFTTLAITPTATGEATSASTVSFIDLGAESTLGDPIGITADDQVALSKGYWSDGTFTPVPTVPDTGDTPAVDSITGDGTIVVDDESAPSSADEDDPEFYAWSPSDGDDGLTAFPPVCMTNADYSEYPRDYRLGATTDDDDEVAFNNPQCPAFANDGVTIHGTSGSYEPIGLAMVGDLNSSFAFGRDAANKNNGILNRSTGAITDVGIAVVAATGKDLSDDGTLAGNLTGSSGPDYTHAETVNAQGVVTPLTIPSGKQAFVEAINDDHTVIGATFSDESDLSTYEAVEWPTPTSSPVDLTDNPNVPEGWTLLAAVGITADGVVVGEGYAPDGTLHDFLLGAGELPATTVKCTNTNDAGTAYSCTVTVTPPEGTTGEPTGDVDLTARNATLSARSCSLTATDTAASCTVKLTAAADATSASLQADYQGDQTFSASTATLTFIDIGGTIRVKCADESACPSKPTPADMIPVELSSGSGVTVRSTSSSQGMYAALVPAGNYTVTPQGDSADFTPKDLTESSPSTTDDFDYCPAGVKDSLGAGSSDDPIRAPVSSKPAPDRTASDSPPTYELKNCYNDVTIKAAGRNAVTVTWVVNSVKCESQKDPVPIKPKKTLINSETRAFDDGSAHYRYHDNSLLMVINKQLNAKDQLVGEIDGPPRGTFGVDCDVLGGKFTAARIK